MTDRLGGNLALAMAMDGAPYGVAVLDASLRFVYINAYLAEVNRRPAAEHIGRHPFELDASEPTRRWVGLAEAALATGTTSGPLRFSRGRGWPVLELAYHPIVTGGSATGVVALVWDVTATAETERREQVLLRATAALARTSTVEEIASVVVDNVVEYLADRAAFGVVDGDQLVIVDIAGHRPGGAGGARGSRLALDESCPACEVARTGASVVVDAAAFDARYPQHAASRAEIGDQVVAVVPVADDETVLGVVAAGWSSPEGGSDADVEAIEAMATVTHGATRRVRLARAIADDQFRRALNASGDGITITRAVRDPQSGEITDFVITYANDKRNDAYGRDLSDLVGRSVLATYPGVKETGLFDRFKQVVDSGQPFTALEYPYRDSTTDPPVTTWQELHVARFDDGYLASSRDVTNAVETRQELEQARIATAAQRQAVQILRRVGLQDSLPTHPGYDIAATYQPSHETTPIGGDWYDVFALDHDRLGIIIGDVAGHGPDSAVAMIEMRSLLGAAARTGRRPDQVLRTVRRAQFRNDTMTTCLYAIVDHRSRTITASSAGHPPPLVAFPHAPPGYLPLRPQPPLGFDLPASDKTITQSLEPGTTLIFYTDGLIERRAESIDTGLTRLQGLFRPDLPPQAQCEHLSTRLTDPDCIDDYCLVVVTLTAP